MQSHIQISIHHEGFHGQKQWCIPYHSGIYTISTLTRPMGFGCKNCNCGNGKENPDSTVTPRMNQDTVKIAPERGCKRPAGVFCNTTAVIPFW